MRIVCSDVEVRLFCGLVQHASVGIVLGKSTLQSTAELLLTLTRALSNPLDTIAFLQRLSDLGKHAAPWLEILPVQTSWLVL